MKEDFSRYINQLAKDSRVKSCFFGDDSCSGKIIKAHSIQNNRFLSKISENGHVVQLTPEESEGDFVVKPSEVGRKKATTKTNFCKFHDSNIFSPIEDKKYEKSNLQQEFLFAYRSFAREYHTKKESDNAYQIVRQALPEERRHLADLALLGTRTSLFQLEKQRFNLNNSLKKSDFRCIKTRRFEFHGEFELAASSMFAIQYSQFNMILKEGRSMTCLI